MHQNDIEKFMFSMFRVINFRSLSGGATNIHGGAMSFDDDIMGFDEGAMILDSWVMVFMQSYAFLQ